MHFFVCLAYKHSFAQRIQFIRPTQIMCHHYILSTHHPHISRIALSLSVFFLDDDIDVPPSVQHQHITERRSSHPSSSFSHQRQQHHLHEQQQHHQHHHQQQQEHHRQFQQQQQHHKHHHNHQHHHQQQQLVATRTSVQSPTRDATQSPLSSSVSSATTPVAFAAAVAASRPVTTPVSCGRSTSPLHQSTPYSATIAVSSSPSLSLSSTSRQSFHMHHPHLPLPPPPCMPASSLASSFMMAAESLIKASATATRQSLAQPQLQSQPAALQRSPSHPSPQQQHSSAMLVVTAVASAAASAVRLSPLRTVGSSTVSSAATSPRSMHASPTPPNAGNQFHIGSAAAAVGDIAIHSVVGADGSSGGPNGSPVARFALASLSGLQSGAPGPSAFGSGGGSGSSSITGPPFVTNRHICPHCGVHFKYKRAQVTHTNDCQAAVAPCPFCPMVLRNRQQLVDHVETHRPGYCG